MYVKDSVELVLFWHTPHTYILLVHSGATIKYGSYPLLLLRYQRAHTTTYRRILDRVDNLVCAHAEVSSVILSLSAFIKTASRIERCLVYFVLRIVERYRNISYPLCATHALDIHTAA